MLNGIIRKGIGGFYYVDTADGIIECRARGKFRRTIGKPMVGDRVRLELQPEDGTGYLLEIEPRKTALVRPPVANIELLAAVASAAPPQTEPFLIDKILAIAEHKGMEVLVVLNKTDLDPADALFQIYQQAGIEVFRVSAETGAGIEALRSRLEGRISAFAGNSGVGKSSLLHRLDPSFSGAVGAISDRIGRGRHTTRHVELIPFAGGYLADTPGFSSFETEQMDLILRDDLQYAFREFSSYLGKCRFTGCAHLCEKGCAVLEAVASGDIPRTRHESYKRLYESVRDLKEWEFKK